MVKHLKFVIVVSVAFLLFNCGSSRFIAPNKVPAQSSVAMTLKDGTVKKGIIFKEFDKQLLFVNAKTHKTDTVAIADIKQVERLNVYYDFNAEEMSAAEIRSNKSYKKTLLYAGGGMILGAAAGTGVAIALFRPKEEGDSGNSGAAIGTIAGMSALGAGVFGWMGAKSDYEDAAFKTRKLHYQKEKEEMDRKKAELEQLKKSK